MLTRAFTDLLPRVSPSAPGCPQPLMLQTIREAAVRVCERTLAWRYTQPVFNLVPGVHEYAYAKPADSEVHVLFGAYVNDNPLEMLTLEQALYKYPDWADLYSGENPSVVWSLTPSGAYNAYSYNDGLFNYNAEFVVPEAAVAEAAQPRSMAQLTPDRYVILPLPDAERPYELRMFCALKPSRTATGMESAVMTELEDAIVHNALQHLLVMPQVAWADRELASYHAKQSLYEITSRRARANLGVMRGTMVANAPRFA